VAMYEMSVRALRADPSSDPKAEMFDPSSAGGNVLYLLYVLYCIVLYYTVKDCTVLTVLYCTILH
jgi:hypothetical protein